MSPDPKPSPEVRKPPHGSRPDPLRSSRRLLIAAGITLTGLLILIVPIEWQHYQRTFNSPQPLTAWMANFSGETSLFFLWLFLLPLAWRMKRVPEFEATPRGFLAWAHAGTFFTRTARERDLAARAPHKGRWVLPAAMGLLGFLNTLAVGHRFDDLPPAFHDEYSYLFQAETFLQGRLSNPRFEPAPELFDQIHVLNLQPGHFVSRYFPGTGLWLTPFLAFGIPYFGYAIAQGLITGLIAALARDLAGNGACLLAGLLTALMPGMMLFSNLLLAHHPGLIGLSLFLWAFHRNIIQSQWSYALAAGIGLTYAMWCRPMTAFGIGLPYGIWFVAGLFRERTWKQRLIQTSAMSGPLVVGLLMLLPYNAATTGDPFLTPYQQYTQNYTPRHVYGFDNRVRGEAWIAEQAAAGVELPIVENYDRWATNLTMRGAIQNERNRLVSTGQWTLGIIPTLAAVLFFLSIGHRDHPEWWLIPAAILSLHLVHLPYWFDGIMHWHYVFEAAPLLALIFARDMQLIVRNSWKLHRPWLAGWWLGLPALGLLISYTTFEPFWQSTLSAGISEIRYAREKHDTFNKMVATIPDTPAVVFIVPDPNDLHLDYVVNDPALDAPVLRAHRLTDRFDIPQLRELFPARRLYQFDVRTSELRELTSADAVEP